MSDTPTISVVVPLFNEEDGLRELIAITRRHLDDVGMPWEIVLVDDGSTDGTWAGIGKEAEALVNLRAVRLSRNFGKEAALCAGLDAARGEAVIVMDGDLEHPPTLIPEMVRHWQATGCDVVEAVKTRHRRSSLAGRLFSAPFNWLMYRLSDVDLRGASDYKLITRRVLDAWLRLGERNLFFRGMVAWLGFHRERIPMEVATAPTRRSRWTPGRLFNLGATGLTAFSSRPLRAAGILGFLFFLFALGLGAHSLWMKFSGRAVEGFTTVIVLQLLIGGLIMFLLGIIGEYIARIYEEVKGRPRYLVADEIHGEGDHRASGNVTRS